ncbi:MAG: serine/threonine protein kinase [Planctomycetes bacterium]|nr:serine/threonine protein kinase [Planctomycetota bacterium]
MSWSPGQQVGDYRIVRELGRGGMGEVYLATDLALGREVALKVVAGATPEVDLTLRLQREAQALARVEHPHVVRVYSAQVLEGRLVVVTEFVPGETLEQVVEERGELEPALAARWVADVAAAVGACHARGILHRDLKPANVMLAPTGVKVMDFGLAAHPEWERLTRTGEVLGTPGYLDPRALDGRHDDPRSDVFSLGGLLYYLLCGRAPFAGATAVEVLTQAALGAFVPLAQARPEVPAWLAAVCERALAPEAEDRFESASAFEDALREGGGPRRGPRLLGVAVALAASSVVALGLVLLSRHSAPPAAGRAPEARDPEQPAPAPETAAPQRQDDFGFSRWPEDELAAALEVYEPWAFRRRPAGLEVRTRAPARPELSLPLVVRRGSPWTLRAELSGLSFGAGANLCLRVVAAASTDAPPRPTRWVGWRLSSQGDGRLLLRCEGSVAEGDTQLSLDCDPRGPLQVELSYRAGALTLRVLAEEVQVAGRTWPLAEDDVPAGQLRLRIGQDLAETDSGSLGEQREGSRWGGEGRFTLRGLSGVGLRLDPAATPSEPAVGRWGWKYLAAEDLAELAQELEAQLDEAQGGNLLRLALYLHALILAGEGRVDAAAERLRMLHGFSKHDTNFSKVVIGEKGWWHYSHWLRNRALLDAVHYSHPLRARVADLLSVPDLEAARAHASQPGPPSPSAAWAGPGHYEGWAWVAAALRLGPDPDAPDASMILARAGLLEEAWALLEANPRPVQPWAARVAFALGLYDEVLRLYEQAPAAEQERFPPRLLESARRWAR